MAAHLRLVAAIRSSGALALMLAACGSFAGVTEKPCRPGCVDERTKLVCDSNGTPASVPCPEPDEPCALAQCRQGTCGQRPAVGAPCGPRGGARCNEGYACLGPFVKLTAGRRHSCALADDGKVWCWGDNTYRQLGGGSDEAVTSSPIQVLGLPPRATVISGGFQHSCALVEDGEAYCWGDSNYGRLGSNTWRPGVYVNHAERVEAPDGVRFSDIRAADSHTCALATDGTVYCWGVTDAGQCGIEATTTGVVQVPNLYRVRFIQSVKNHTCAVREVSPSLVCWGDNRLQEGGRVVDNKLGPGAAQLAYSATPIPVEFPGYEVLGVGMGYETTFAVVTDGKTYAFGLTAGGRLGTGSSGGDGATPSPIKRRDIMEFEGPLGGTLTIVRSGSTGQCARTSDGRYMCWGTDNNGELGFGAPAGQTQLFATPASVLPPSADNMVRGESHACITVRTEDHTEVRCYGEASLVANGGTGVEQFTPEPIVWDPSRFASTLESDAAR